MKKNEIPNIEYQKSTKKEKILAIVCAIVYCLQFLLGKIVPENATINVVWAILISYYVITFIVTILCFKSTFKKDFKIFKNNAKSYFKYILPKYGIAYLIFIVCNAICLQITNQNTSVNQATLNALPLWFVIPVSVIWAPIVEEVLYRGILRKFIKNNVLFIIVTTAIFSLVHTTHEANLLNVIVMAIPYATLGGLFGYVYAKTNNIINGVFLHFLQNFIASVLSIILLFVVL